MQTKKFLDNTAFAPNTGGYIDVLRTRFQPNCANAGAITAANALIEAIRDERNNVHSLLVDGITDGAIVIVAGSATDGGKLRYIVRELITAIEANAPYGVGLVNDISKGFVTPPITGVRDVQYQEIGIFADFVNAGTVLITNNTLRTTALDLRAITLAAAYALWDAVATL